jgi:Protein of unknown function (DUF3575)
MFCNSKYKNLGLLIVALFFTTQISYSQDQILKVNLSSFAIKSASVQYEKVLNRRVSFNLGVGYRPMALIPFPSQTNGLVKFVDERIDYISLDNTRPKESEAKGYQITPELRFYLGNNEAPTGFYIAVYGRYNHINAIVPVEMELEYNSLPVSLKLPVDTKVNTYSAGLMIGKQFKLGNRFTFDCNLIGLSVGKLTIHGESLQDLGNFNEDFHNRLKAKVIDGFKIDESVFDVAVNKNGIYMDALKSLQYINVRTLGFSLGYRF